MIQFILDVLCENNLVALIDILLYCIFCINVNCLLTEHLAECERFKYLWLNQKSKVYQVRFLVSPFCTKCLLHEPNEFIHVRVVNKLQIQRVVNKLQIQIHYCRGCLGFWSHLSVPNAFYMNLMSSYMSEW